MGYVLPGWLDEILDFIGINWPNVDEDDYREMAEAMREFADRFETHGGEAVAVVNRVIASSEGAAVDALAEHWGKVKSSHLEQVPQAARTFATACDVVADVIYGMKIKAEIELGAMAASLGISIGLAFVTGGLSALIGAAQTAAMRELIRRIIKEAQEEIVDRLIAEVTEPVTGKLEKLAEDVVLDIASGVLDLPADAGPGTGAGEGGGHHGGLALASAGGGPSSDGMRLDSAGAGGVGAGQVRIDHREYEEGATRLARHGQDLQTSALRSLTRAKGAFGRSKGRDSFTQAFDSVLDGALNGTEKALKKVGRHLTENVPNGIRTNSRNHQRNEQRITDALDRLRSRAAGGDGNGPSSSGGPHSPRTPGAAGRRDGNHSGGDIRLSSAELTRRARSAAAKTCENDPIDMATGEMLLPQTDLELPGVPPLVLRRTHLSTYRHGRFFGPSWASTLDERLERGADGIWWHREDGSSLVYEREPGTGDEVQPAKGEPFPLIRLEEGSGYALAVTDPHSGLTRVFRAAPESGPDIWWLAALEDRNGNEIHYDRAPDGTPSALVHLGGYHAEVRTDPGTGLVGALLLRTPDGPAQVMAYSYDGRSDLTGVTNSSGLPLRFTYDEAHRITSWTDRNGSVFTYVYDDRGRVVRTVGPEGVLSSRLAYDTDGDTGERVTRYTNSQGATTTYRMNDRYQVVAVTDPLGHTVHQEWDHRDRLLSRTDALGRTTRYTYDEAGDLTALELPDGSRSRAAYNRLHLPETITGPDGATWHQTYDPRGNRTVVTAPDGTTTRFTHDPTGAVTSVTDPAGATHRLTNDATGLPVSVTDPLGATESLTRDSFGRPVTLTDPLGAVTRLEWTTEGRLSRRTAPDGTTESWTWDGEGNCLTHTDPNGGETRYEYGHFDKLTARTGPDGVRYAFRYDTELRLAQVLAPRGLTWDYRYDPIGRLTAETDFDGRALTYTHDPAGRLVSRTTPLGQEITYTYDTLDRPTAKNADGARTTYTYDPAGHLIRAVSPTSALALERDVLGRVLSETVDGRTTRYTYDAAGRRTSRTTPTGVVTELAYDDAGNRTRLTVDGHTLAFRHDALGRELERAFGGPRQPVTLTTAWDAIGRPAQQSLAARGRTLRSRSYTYRPDDHLTALTDHLTGTVRQFALDPVGRPLAVTADGWSERYAYDAAGNQTHASWPDEAPHPEARGDRSYTGTRLLTAGRVRYEYDAAGRTVSRRKTRLSRKPGIWRYEWDAEDRLTACTTPDGTRWTYAYDPLGRRTAKHRVGPDGSPAETVHFTWDGTRLAEETTSTTGVTLTWDHDGHRPLTQTERRLSPADRSELDRRFFALVTDLIGTPTELVDETGHIAWHTRATLWGTTTWNRDATAYTPLRFPGQYADPETGLHYNFFRHYDPDTGRYASPDPLGLVPAPNPMTYVHNPATAMDVLGLAPCRVFAVSSAGTVNVLPVAHFSERDFPGVNENLAEALARGESPIVTRQTGRRNIRRNRRHAQQGLDRPPSDMTWEEYPFASSAEGGRGAVTTLVERAENNRQGGFLSAFYTQHGIRNGDQFYVAPEGWLGR
ncbi:DUF6531 domain-containing protein [Streptomyces sp. NPDC052020]|uniref:DUF6531 domain-containing protein n=1 Tax=Streptomyces sp. NPDC052020 TaxID=3155677 RepID=UPI00344551FD